MKAIIVEDNPSAVNLLKSYLKEYPAKIDIAAQTSNIENAVKMIRKHRPEIWFLDIELEDKPVFGMFKDLDEDTISRASIIFISAHFNAEYMHEALKKSAIDYINKPIDKKQLFDAIDKAKEKAIKADLSGRLSKLEDAIRKIPISTQNDKIPVYRSAGKIDYIFTRDILYIGSDNALTKIVFLNGDFITSTKSLKFYEEVLGHNRFFFRTSKQYILNLEHVVCYDPVLKEVTLNNELILPVSRRNSSALQDYLKHK